jgi:23S rRNA (cytosine1962-C5)-methyltransferase
MVILKAGKERPLALGHPWVYSGAIAALDVTLPAGTLARIETAEGRSCGRGYVNPRCTIAVRMLTHVDEAIDAAFFRRRVAAAVCLRSAVVPAETNTYRVLNGEGDGLPGFVVDRYGDVLVLQCLTAGAARLRAELVSALADLLRPHGIYERSVGAVRREEGLSDAIGVVEGEVPEGPVTVREYGQRLFVDVRRGQKTGLFLDQRENRRLVSELAAGRRVLNAFSYTGAFAVAAAMGGARSVVSVDSSAPALALARDNWAANPIAAAAGSFIAADVFAHLRDSDADYDMLILDPPALVKRRQDVRRGARAYHDLHRWAFRRAAPDALILTFSCSQHLPLEHFRRIVHHAAVEAGRRVQVLRPLSAAPDHPTSLAHPEGEYLKGLLLRVF